MGKKGGDDVYQSPHYKSTDDIGFQTLLGALTGQGVGPSPEINSNMVAEQLGGKYSPKTGLITMPDGSAIKFDPLLNTFVDASGPAKQVPNSSGVSGGGRNPGKPTTATSSGKPNAYLDKANETLQGLNSNVYGNPNSAYNLFSENNSQRYNAKTGQYETPDAGAPADDSLSAENYLDQYGQYLDTAYNKTGPYQASEYNQFNYTSPTIGSVENISDAARADIYQKGADRISSAYRDEQQNLDDFLARNNSNLSSGRAARAKNEIAENRTRELTGLERQTETDHQMRKFNDAAHVRDMQASQDQQTQLSQGNENKTAQMFNQDENRYAYDTGNKENKYAYEAGQKQGQDKFGIVEGINTNNRNQAFQELQANRQQTANKQTWINDLLRIYAGQDATAAQLQAAKANAIGSTLGGLFGAAGAVGAKAV